MENNFRSGTMKKDIPVIYVISGDTVFISLIEKTFNMNQISQKTEISQSFIDLKEKKSITQPSLVILDDLVTGAASPEIITFLRFNRRLECPILLFCENVPDLMEKALKRGANRCITKPFNLRQTGNVIITSLS